MPEDEQKHLRNYGEKIPPQESVEALFDPQIKNMSFNISGVVGSSDKGTILDIGCGNGIILERLNNIDSFLKKKGWEYLGIDVEEYEDDLLILAAKLKLHRRVDFMQLKNFQEMEISAESYPLPVLTIIRNVFHELDINKTSALLYKLISIMDQDGSLFVQDLQIFPEAEKDNVCWQPEYFKEMLARCGFDYHFVEEPTKSGNKWFTMGAKRNGEQSLNIKQVKDVVIKYRKEQLKNWDQDTKELINKGSREKEKLVVRELEELALRKQIEAVEKEKSDSPKDTPSTISKIPTVSTLNIAIEKYRKKAESLHGALPVAGFITQLKVPIDIEDIFIPLRAIVDLRGVQENGKFADAAHAEKTLQECDCSLEISLLEAFHQTGQRNQQGIVILGDPGSGKTTHLKRLLLYCLRESPEKLYLDANMLPVFLPLRELYNLDEGIDSFMR